MKNRFLLMLVLSFSFYACGDDESPEIDQDNFDRGAMLSHWADNIIVPGYTSYVTSLSQLSSASTAFVEDVSTETLNDLSNAWMASYVEWQKVSMFEIGKAEELTLRDFTNVFPADIEGIDANILSGDYNLALPSTRDQQGFPAIDYLLHGNDLTTTLENFSQTGYQSYLTVLVDRMNALATEVLNDWNSGYRDSFVSNDGSEASSSTNKLVNDYMFYYEKALRAGKIGIPAGIFSTSPLSDRVEAVYKRDVSKQLYETALTATIDFFNGRSASGNGPSLATYLEFLNTITEGENLASAINNQFNAATNISTTLDDDFYNEVETNNTTMLAVFDELQKAVPLLKVDMFQALNVRVDFVDADGD